MLDANVPPDSKKPSLPGPGSGKATDYKQIAPVGAG